MKISVNILCFIISFGLFTGCMEVVEVDVPKGEELLAVEGMITDQPGPYAIKLSKTAPYFSEEANKKVSDALIILNDSEGNVDTLKEATPGSYYTTTIAGKIGNSYTLYIKSEGEEYKAETAIKRVPAVDSLLFTYAPENKDRELEEGYYPRYFGPEFQGIGDFYRLRVYKNDTLNNRPIDLAITNDEFVDGKYIGDLELDEWRFKKEDKIRVEMLSVTEDTYQFFYEMFTQINNSQAAIFANPVANVRSNIINQNPSSTKKAVGWFYGAGVSFKEGYVMDDKTVIK